jgi:hypothetical protein
MKVNGVFNRNANHPVLEFNVIASLSHCAVESFHTLRFKPFSDPSENPVKHGLRQFSGLGILLAGMVGRDNGLTVLERINSSMAKVEWGNLDSPLPHGLDGLCQSNLTQGNDDLHVLEKAHLTEKIRPAVFYLFRQRLVLGRSTSDRGCDVTVFQSEPVTSMRGAGLVGKPKLVESPKKPLPASISREHSSCPVSTLRGRGKTNDQKAGSGVTETWQRFGPVLPLVVPSGSAPFNFPQIGC